MIGRENSGLYLLKDEITAMAGAATKDNNETDLWHIRLGHLSPKVMEHIMNTARALSFQSGMPIRYLGHCVKTSTYSINKIPCKVLEGKSPHEVLYREEPSLHHLRVFGCLCFASVLPIVDKFAP